MSIVALGPSTCASVKHIVSIRCSMGLSRTRYGRDERASAWVPNPCLPRSLDYSLLGRVGEHPLPRLTLRSAPPVRCPRCGAGQCQWGSDPAPAAALTVRCGACLAPLRLRLDWADSVAPGRFQPHVVHAHDLNTLRAGWSHKAGAVRLRPIYEANAQTSWNCTRSVFPDARPPAP